MISLRPYQLEAVEAVRQAYGTGRRQVLFVMPTGSGKTTVFSHITNGAAAKGNRVLLLVHRVELLDQASARLTQMGVGHGLIAAGRAMDLAAPVQLASVQTLARRLQHMPEDHFQLVIVDEAHHATAGTWAKTLGHFHHARVLGVTATPCRTDGRGLGEMFDEMVLGPSSAWLTEQGFLAPARVFAPPIGFSVKGLRKTMGDFDMKQAGEELGGRSIMGDVVGHYRKHLEGRTAIAFCCSVAHAEAVAAAFREHGVNAASIDGTMDVVTRRELLQDLGTGGIKVLTSCSLIGEGVDVPSVAGCIVMRPTQSLSLHLQMIGRCLRPQPGKEAIVLDHVGNVERLGHHLDEQEWTLDGVKKKDGKKAPSVKVCPECFATMSSQVSRCSECGHEFAPGKRELKTKEGELVEMKAKVLGVGAEVEVWFGKAWKAGFVLTEFPPTGSVRVARASDGSDWGVNREHVRLLDPIKARRREQGGAQTLEQLIAVGQQRGMKNPRGWARHVLAARQAKGMFERVPA